MFIKPNSKRWLSLEDLPNEEWKDIKDYGGLYQISNYGRVKSLKRLVTSKGSYSGYISIKECIRKVRKGNRGYWYLNLYKNGMSKTKKLHRLVAENFLEDIDGKEQVNHIDGNKDNNTVSNLEYCTSSENNKHAFAIGLKKIWNKDVYGKANSNTRAIKQYDINGKFIKKFDCIADASRELSIKYHMILRVCKGIRKQTHNYIFIYDGCDKQ